MKKELNQVIGKIGVIILNEANHPEFKEEELRLDFTKRYMSVVIQTARSNKEQFMKSMKEAFMDVDWIESGGYSQLLTNASFYQLSHNELDSLTNALPKPYFARVDFTSDESNEIEKLYFGKTSLFQRDSQEQIIIDWRSPIANLYYEGRLGEVAYESEGERYSGLISLKRQYMIEDGKLLDIRDIDMTTVDDLLQESLSQSSANRLTEIVATIQEEQNQIIRADLNKPIIVQGAAGSGKTTIALHRISYFLYHYKDVFDPEQLLILAPSLLFIDYISEALPELGVEKARQSTFTAYVQLSVGKKIPLVADRKLIELLEEKDEHAHISSIKGQSIFQKVLDRYVNDILKRLQAKKDFKIDKFRLYSAKRFNHLLNHEYTYLPIYKRINKLKTVLRGHLRTNKTIMQKKVAGFFDAKIDKALQWKGDEEKRKEYVSQAIDKKADRLKELDKELKTAVNSYMKQFEMKDTLTLYKELFDNPKTIFKYSEGEISLVQARRLCHFSNQIFSKGKFELEDLGAILYLHAKIYGVKSEIKAKNVVIDEAQDYSFMQLQGLKTALDTDMFTLVGDLAQGIHSYRGLREWEEVIHKIFPRASYKELEKSYRTTIEIMMEANKLLDLLPMKFPRVQPVVRHGLSPQFYQIDSKRKWALDFEEKVGKLRGEGFHTFAIITKTRHDAKLVNKWLKEWTGLDAHLLEEQTAIPKNKIAVLPSYLSKGLEFDVVFAFSYEELYSKMNEIDIKLLYVVMTRALHRLYLVGKEKRAFILEE